MSKKIRIRIVMFALKQRELADRLIGHHPYGRKMMSKVYKTIHSSFLDEAVVVSEWVKIKIRGKYLYKPDILLSNSQRFYLWFGITAGKTNILTALSPYQETQL